MIGGRTSKDRNHHPGDRGARFYQHPLLQPLIPPSSPPPGGKISVCPHKTRLMLIIQLINRRGRSFRLHSARVQVHRCSLVLAGLGLDLDLGVDPGQDSPYLARNQGDGGST